MGDTSVVGLMFRLIGSLAIVVGALFLLARFANKRIRTGSGTHVSVIARQPLSRSAGVSVITVGARVLVVGTTEQSVSLLAELDPDELLDVEAAEDAEETGGTEASDGLKPTTLPARTGPLSGSILSPTTWKQTMAAFTGSPPPGERKAS